MLITLYIYTTNGYDISSRQFSCCIKCIYVFRHSLIKGKNLYSTLFIFICYIFLQSKGKVFFTLYQFVSKVIYN